MSKSTASGFTLVRVIVFAGVLLLLASLVGWWRSVYSSPSNVFDRMLSNSLSSPSVSKVLTQGDESQTLRQTSTLVTVPEQIVRAISVHDQTVANNKTSVTTESIGTPHTDFVRYTDFKTTEKNSQGQDFDFSSVIGVWGKSSDENPANDVQVLNQSLLGVVPAANVPAAQRKALLEQIKKDNVYKTDAGAAKHQVVNGRPVYTYDVEIAPVAYVTMLKSFARAIGVTSLEQVDPSQYAQSQPLKFVFDIDVWSGQLTKVAFTNTARNETYRGYGARIKIDEPTSTIDINELQNRIQQLQ